MGVSSTDRISAQSRCRLSKEWAEDSGGAIHPAKTQWLDINATYSPPPGVHGGTGQYLYVIERVDVSFLDP